MQGNEAMFHALKAIRSNIDVAGYLADVAKAFGFSGFMMLDIPAAADEHLQPRIGLSNLPSGLLEDYDRLGLLRHSPIFASLRRSTVPASWVVDAPAAGRPEAQNAAAHALFRRHNLTMGVFFPVHGPDGSRAAIGYDGDRPPLSHLELSELNMLSIHVFDIYCALKASGRGETNTLTVRELEVLHWAASGKTSTEIAAILSLSDHTVNTYMNTAMRKLDCVNRTQLVAKALRLRLIS